MDAPLSVCILGQDTGYRGKIVNVSQGGMRFVCDVAFPVGEVLRFDLADQILVGTVRYCSPQDYRFATGIELQNVISKPEFEALLEDLKSDFVLG